MTSWTPLSHTEHMNKGCKPHNGYHYAANHQVAEVLISELSSILTSYALGFIKQGDRYKFIALLSLGGDRNLYVNQGNMWMCQYVPAGLRSYPFRLANDSETGKRVLCIAESHLTDDPDSIRLFDDEGNLTAETAAVLEFIDECDDSRNRTQTACNALADAGVIEPWKLSVKTSEVDEEPRSIGGVYRINETALNELFKPVLVRLRDAGALPIAYAQLFSMKRFRDLGTRAHYLAKEQEHVDKPLDLAGLFEEEEPLNFEDL